MAGRCGGIERFCPGQTYSRVIQKALDEARCVVAVWSQRSVDAHWVLDKATNGQDRGILISARIDEVRVPQGFGLIQAARLDGWQGELDHPEFSRLIQGVTARIGPPTPAIDEPKSEPEVPDTAEELPLGVLEEREDLEQDAAPEPAPPPSDTRVRNPIGMEFVLIRAGTFQMGSEDGHAHEQPVHTVWISQPFYLGITPVTQAQWEAMMADNPSGFQDNANCPVESVSWEDGQTVVSKLEEREPGVRYRLPTEAEWEYAAHAGTTTAYRFGDDASQLGEYAWYNANSGFKTRPVGQLNANGWGLHDMHGNVWEWVQDRYGNYTAATTADSEVDPSGPAAGVDRVVCGGSWVDLARSCRSSDRGGRSPGYRSPRVGCRVLRLV
jgi:formylglycine-generating enzyme required for sulfatase activity